MKFNNLSLQTSFKCEGVHVTDSEWLADFYITCHNFTKLLESWCGDWNEHFESNKTTFICVYFWEKGPCCQNIFLIFFPNKYIFFKFPKVYIQNMDKIIILTSRSLSPETDKFSYWHNLSLSHMLEMQYLCIWYINKYFIPNSRQRCHWHNLANNTSPLILCAIYGLW